MTDSPLLAECPSPRPSCRAQRCYHSVQSLAGDIEPDARVLRLQDELFAVVADLEELSGVDPSAFVWPPQAPRS